jgi:hypothetical protein
MKEIPAVIFSSIEPKTLYLTIEILNLHFLQNIQQNSRGKIPKSNHE